MSIPMSLAWTGDELQMVKRSHMQVVRADINFPVSPMDVAMVSRFDLSTPIAKERAAILGSPAAESSDYRLSGLAAVGVQLTRGAAELQAPQGIYEPSALERRKTKVGDSVIEIAVDVAAGVSVQQRPVPLVRLHCRWRARISHDNN